MKDSEPIRRRSMVDPGSWRDRVRFGLGAGTSGQAPATVWLTLAWVLVMVATPIILATSGPAARPIIIIVGVLAQLAVVAAALWNAWGIRNLTRVAAGVVLLAWAAEFVGSQTGFPFGAYKYTSLLQPQLGHVPVIIPFAWLMMLPPAWAVARRITGRSRGHRFVAVSALALTAWDLFLDPQMVSWGFWRWQQPGGYFGIPWVNFLGWILVAGFMSAVLRPLEVPSRPLLAIYGVTWALESIGLLVFWQLPGPALVGFVAMGAFFSLAWRRGSET